MRSPNVGEPAKETRHAPTRRSLVTLSSAPLSGTRDRAGAVLRAAAGIALLSIMDVMVKGLMVGLPFVQAIFLRFLCGLVAVLAVCAMARPGRPSAASIRANLLRTPLVVLATLTFFFSVKELPLAEALSLAFLAPVFIALFGGLLLREHIDWRIGLALAMGFAGMLVISSPRWSGGLAQAPLGVAAALASAVFYALNIILLRRLALREHPAIIVLFQNGGPAALLALPAFAVWQPVSFGAAALALAAGALAVGGHLALTSAFARSEASRLAPLEYTSLVWAASCGYLFFDETPALATLAGAALIVVGSLLVGRRPL